MEVVVCGCQMINMDMVVVGVILHLELPFVDNFTGVCHNVLPLPTDDVLFKIDNRNHHHHHHDNNHHQK